MSTSQTARPAGQARPAPKEPLAHSNPIVAALHEMASTMLGEQLREMFERADDILFDSAEKARGGKEQQVYLDTMRTVRMQRAKILEAFRTSLRDALLKVGDPGTPQSEVDTGDASQWSLVAGDAVEELIAVRNMETKAVSLHSHELVELQRRLSRLADLSGGSLSPEAMAPARIIRAFQASIEGLQVEFPIKLVILKLFDRLVVGRLSEVIVGANHLLAEHGVEPKPEKRQTGRQSRPAAIPGSANNQPPAWAAGINASTLSRFMGAEAAGAQQSSQLSAGGYPSTAGAGWGWMPSPTNQNQAAGGWPGTQPQQPAAQTGYSDAALAQEISAILSSLAAGRWSEAQAPGHLPAPNVALVARMFDDYFRDPRLTDRVKPILARMQLPVMKAALSDPRFFSDTAHPARRSINDLFEILLQFSAADAAPKEAYDELSELVQSMAKALDLDPAKLLNAKAQAVDDDAVDKFLDEQDAQMEQRSRARVDRVRRIVAHELRSRIGERQLPKSVMRLMLSGMAPLLSVDYVRDGLGGESWNQTMGLVDRIVNSVQSQDANADVAAHEEADIVAAVSRRLAGIGFSEGKLQQVLSGLMEAFLERPRNATEVSSAAADQVGASAAPAPSEQARATVTLSPEQRLQQLLFVILVPGGWFTLIDPASKTKYWLRVKSFYPAQNSVLLGHYMEDRYLKLHATSFATALAEGRAGLIDPSPELRDAVGQIAAIPFRREIEALIWTTNEGQAPAAAG
jgi:hypothetical protein